MTVRSMTVANWKLNGCCAQITQWMQRMRAVESRLQNPVVLCTPAIYLPLLRDLTADSIVRIGAQDVSAHRDGAHTGEISATMLAEFGVKWCIIGHSERRQFCHESNERIAQKALRLIEQGIRPILCVGETLEQRQAGQTMTVITQQIQAVLDVIGPSFDGAIAYEPVWAIGTGQAATPQDAQNVLSAIAQIVPSACVTLLYGGSVKASNAASLFARTHIHGGLIGGASLKVADFFPICQVLDHVSTSSY